MCLLRGTDWMFIYNSGYVFCVDLRTKSDISLYRINWLVFITETECLLRGTDWIFICNGLNFVLKWLKNVRLTSVGIRHKPHIKVDNTAVHDRLMRCVADG